jgi:isoleucyl-tRNA synthetase
MDPQYETAQLEVFRTMYENKLIYRALRPVYWSFSTRTALAEAELEYMDDHVSQSTFVALKIQEDLNIPNLHALIWTTTPWTLPANEAVAYHPTHSYSVVKYDDKHLIVMSSLIPALRTQFKHDLPIVTEIKSLEGLHAQHPLFDRAVPLLAGLHVLDTAGTGLVHTAPAHGKDDYLLGHKHVLPLTSYVNDDGTYNKTVGIEQLVGLEILGEGNQKAIELLGEKLIFTEPYKHRYPYDWRSKKPVIVRATMQWFTDLGKTKEIALSEIDSVKFIPESGRTRLHSFVSARDDWCISRQRYWGVPIPVKYKEDQLEITDYNHDQWWETEEENGCRKGKDTLDVWFDSGSSWKSVLGEKIADVYLEGSDQHRGWFQSSLLTSVAYRGKAPYKTIITHGFTLDEQGRKMSKSLGNVLDFRKVIDKYGADVLRLWVGSVDFTGDMFIGPNALGTNLIQE